MLLRTEMIQSSPRAVSKIKRIPGLDELRGLGVIVVLFCHLMVLRLPTWSGSPVITAEGITNRTSAISTSATTPVAWIDGAFERGYPPFVALLGWAGVPGDSSGSGLKAVLVSIDGGPFLPTTTGVARPDVLTVYPNLPERCGWRWYWPVKGIAGGHHVVRIRVQTEDGNATDFERAFILAAPERWPFGSRWWHAFGQISLDVFFVISGFLITGILLRTKECPGYFSSFYARRAWRILPLAVAVVFIYCSFRPEVWPFGRYCLFFCANLGSVLPLPHGYLVPFWSLAVEEQFYLLMPALVAFTPKRHLGTVVGCLCLALVVPRMVGVNLIDGLYPDNGKTLCRALPLAVGAWLALLREGHFRRPMLWIAGLAIWMGVVWCAGGRLGLVDGFGLVIVPAVVWLAVTDRFVIRNSMLRFLGVRCYGIYLLHNPLLEVLQVNAPSLHNVWFTLLWLAMVLIAACLSFRYFERPLLKLAPSQPEKQLTTALPLEAQA